MTTATYYDRLRKRQAQERAHLAAMTTDQARASVQRRLDAIDSLISDYQSRYNVPRPCVCLR